MTGAILFAPVFGFLGVERRHFPDDNVLVLSGVFAINAQIVHGFVR